MKTAILNTVFQMTQKGSTLILVVLLMRFFLRDYSKKISYFAWLPVGICLLVPWQISLPVIPAAAGKIHTAVPVLENIHTIGAITTGTMNVGTVANSNSRYWLFWAWAAGVATMICYTLAQYLKLISGISKAAHLKENQYQIQGTGSPFTFGLVHPKIYLPADISAADRWCVLQHEQVHIRRHDGLFKLLGYLALCVHFFNPLVWIAFHYFENDMEMSCDEEAVRAMNREERTQYAESLVNVATDRRSPLVSSFSNQKKEVLKRMKNIFFNKKSRNITIISITAILTLTVFVSFKLTVKASNKNAEVISFRNPLDAPKEICGYGCTTGHNGEDIVSSNPTETEIKAVANGTVLAIGTDATLGDWIILSHADNWYSFYASLGTIQAEVGDSIKTGQTIASLGLSGQSTTPHVHLAIRQFENKNENYLNHFLSAGGYPDDQVYQFYEGTVPTDDAAASANQWVEEYNREQMYKFNQSIEQNGYVYDDGSDLSYSTTDSQFILKGNSCIYSNYVDVIIGMTGDNIGFEIGSHCIKTGTDDAQGPTVIIPATSSLNQLPTTIQVNDHAKLYYQFPNGYTPTSYEDYVKYATALK